MDWFRDWFGTRYYALLYGHRDHQDAKEWVDMIVSRAHLRPGQRLLDLACGRGRHAEWFAKAGLQVTGVDISEPSIEEARARVPGHHFEVHDIRTPFADSAFDAVVCLFTSLGYSPDRKDDEQAVFAACRALRPGGRFVLDLMNGTLLRERLVAQEAFVIDGVGFTLERELRDGDIIKHIQVEDAGHSLRFREQVHLWEVDEVVRMVEGAGLRVEDLTDGPDPTPFRLQESSRIVVHACRP